MNPAGSGCGGFFVDAHVHIRQGAALDEVAAAGISAVRDAGARENAAGAFPAGKVRANGPLVVPSGWALFKKGGYGSLFGIPVETREEMRAEILKLRNAGAGIIKIMASGMVSLKEPGRVTPGGFDRNDLAWLVAEAASHGLGVMAHANGEQAIIDAAESGVRSVEHGFFMSVRALEVMARKKIFWVPTVGALERAARSIHASPETEAFVAGLIRGHLQMIVNGHAAGVPLAVGTDCVLPDPGYKAAYDVELAYLGQAGLSNDEVRKIACGNGARLLGIER